MRPMNRIIDAMVLLYLLKNPETLDLHYTCGAPPTCGAERHSLLFTRLRSPFLQVSPLPIPCIQTITVCLSRFGFCYLNILLTLDFPFLLWFSDFVCSVKMSAAEAACSYALMILHDDNIPVTVSFFDSYS